MCIKQPPKRSNFQIKQAQKQANHKYSKKPKSAKNKHKFAGKVQGSQNAARLRLSLLFTTDAKASDFSLDLAIFSLP